MSRLERIIGWGLLVIVAVMPFHAFLSVWAGHTFGHEAIFQAWKEFLLIVLSILTLILTLREPARLRRLSQPWIIATAAFIVLALAITALRRPGLVTTAFGIKTDLEFLLAALIAVLVSAPALTKRLIQVVLIGATLVTGYDVMQIFLLPANFLTHFGYGPTTIAPFQHIAAGTNALRFPATLGGPNQLGTYLMLPLTIIAVLYIKRRSWWLLGLFVTSIISLVWTFSRSAWLGALLAVAVAIFASLPQKLRRPAAWGTVALVAVCLLTLPFALKSGGSLQYFILHSSLATHDQANLSDAQHASSLHYGLSSLLHNPLGAGLGTAGPATFHIGGINIIENYYLQIGFEIGIMGVIGFIAIISFLIATLLRSAHLTPLAVATAAAIIGISFVALVLPAWVDSTTALIVWICAGAVTGLRSQVQRV